MQISARAFKNAYLLAKFGFDTAENEPCTVCSRFNHRRAERDGNPKLITAALASSASLVVIRRPPVLRKVVQTRVSIKFSLSPKFESS